MRSQFLRKPFFIAASGGILAVEKNFLLCQSTPGYVAALLTRGYYLLPLQGCFKETACGGDLFFT